jgi:hypothetical protein
MSWIEDGLHIVNGARVWLRCGVYHRLDGPAIEHPDCTKIWYINGKLHRIGGAAVERPNGDNEWWLNGVPYTEKIYNRAIHNLPLFYWKHFRH